MDSAPVRGRSDLQVVSDIFRAINDNDRDAALGLIHPDASWAPTVWSGARTLRSREEIRGWFDQFGPALEDLRVDLAEVRRGKMEEHVAWTVALGTVHDSRGRESLSSRVGWRFAVQQGMVVEGRSYPTWPEALQAAGIRPAAASPTSEVELDD